MKLNVFIIHGAYGSPSENWFPWLKAKFEGVNIPVYVPSFPTPENQNLENWLKEFEKYESYINQETVFCGHSLGPAFILNVLEKLKNPVLACFLVSAFTGLLNLPEFDDINRTITDRNFNYTHIRSMCKHFFIYNSDNDPYVPLEKGKHLAKALDGKLTVIEGGGHINAGAGFKEFELLFKDVMNFLEKSNRL